MPEEQKDQQEKPREKRVRRFKIGWLAVPALALLALTVWLLVNMAQQSGDALIRVAVGIFVVLAAAAVLFKAMERPTHVD